MIYRYFKEFLRMFKVVRPFVNVMIILGLVTGLTAVISLSAAKPANAAVYNTGCTNQHLEQGDSGLCVSDLQRKLLAKNINPGTIDGVFGTKTKSAVMRFQTSAKL